MKRKIIKIDESKCDGCGECVPNCHEGALQIIDGKARLISDLFCDGLGACIGHCPQGALTIEEREAEPYDEKKVMDYIVKGGENVIKAHLEHLYEHGEKEFLRQAVEYLDENGIPLPDLDIERKSSNGGGCPGSQSVSFETEEGEEIIVKVGISFVSIDGARKNLEKEMEDFNFDRVKNDIINNKNS